MAKHRTGTVDEHVAARRRDDDADVAGHRAGADERRNILCHTRFHVQHFHDAVVRRVSHSAERMADPVTSLRTAFTGLIEQEPLNRGGNR